MKHQTFVMGSILAVGIVAVVICVGMVSGYSVFKPLIAATPVSNVNTGIQSVAIERTPVNTPPYITIDPVADKTTGDLLIVKGTTNLPNGTSLMVLTRSYGGNTEVNAGSNGINQYSMPIDTSVLKPGNLTITVTQMIGDPAKGNYGPGTVKATASFTLKGTYLSTDTPVQPTLTASDYIHLNAIGDRSVGNQFLITGTTSLPIGTGVIWQVSPISLTTDPNQTETATGMMATSQVTKGEGNTNRVSFAMDTNELQPDQYYVTVSTSIGNLSQEFKPEGLTGSALFNLISGPAGTGQSVNDTSVPDITINPVNDVPTGDPLIISGTTNLPVGTEFKVSVIPAASTSSSTYYKQPELAATISVVKGSTTGNLFSATLATNGLPQGQHIILVSAEDAQVTGSALFNVE